MARRLIDNPHLCRPHGRFKGFSVHVRGAVSINICFYEWKVGRLEKLLPMWTLACPRWSVPRLATRLRAGSTATHDPQPIRSFVSLERVPRPRAFVYPNAPPRSFLCLVRNVILLATFSTFFSPNFYRSTRIESTETLGSIVFFVAVARISELDRCWENELRGLGTEKRRGLVKRLSSVMTRDDVKSRVQQGLKDDGKNCSKGLTESENFTIF